MSNRPLPLAEDTVGPYYPYSFVDDDRTDLTRLHHGLSVGPQGTQIVLRGHLVDCEGEPVEDALIEFWQANAAGVRRTPHNTSDPALDPYFDGHGRLVTTRAPFEFTTIKPGATAADQDEAARAPHVTVTLFSDGITRLVTQIFFSDEPAANAADPLLLSLPSGLRQRLVAQLMPARDGEAATYEIRIVMRGDGETPFFDDLSS